MSSDAGPTTQTLSDKTLARRRYFREKQREYRRKMNAEGAAMEAEVVHLQSILDGLQAKSLPSVREARDSILSWHSIAMVFKSEAHRVLTDRESLGTQAQEYRTLIASMQRFVMMNIPVRVLLPSSYDCATEVRQVSPTHIVMRTVSQLTRPFRAYDGFVSSDELAVLRGIDVTGIEDNDQKEAFVWRELIRQENAQFLLWRRRFAALMQVSS
ncbi:hypothetical protein DYB28_009753 [Aphanomyces astaci]|uniref:Uncharacterized protein n=1 Tax=Aphanomyces astaci TaxID=112090 RepID=A0A9X8E322_APHAT|nr:hypothetical protein DYB28_009753 [Aphanomyces astaci]